MDIQIHNTTTILNHANPNSEPYLVPFTIFDRFATNIHIAVLYAFTPPTPPNSVIIEALKKTLLHFPPLTGQLVFDDDRESPSGILIGANGGGALVVEATVNSDLSDFMPLEPSRENLRLHPPVEDPAHLFQVQINRFNCGGLIVGASAHHKAGDGLSMSFVFAAWGQTVRGVPINPLPTFDKSWLKPRVPPKCEFKHWNLDFLPLDPNEQDYFLNDFDVEPSKIKNILLHFSSEFINKKLKPKMKQKFTTFESLLAHLWRKISIARMLDDTEKTHARISVNGRCRIDPPVPYSFFGNLVANAYPKSTVKQLIGGDIEDVAKLIHDSISSTNGKYFQSMIDFGSMYEDEELLPVYDTGGNVLSPVLEVDSWLKFRFEDVDFGCGSKLCGFLPTWVPFEGLVILLPSVSEDGGIDVFLTILDEDAKRLREISHSID